MAALDARIDHDGARADAKRIAERLAAPAPDRYTIAAALEKRAGHIFIDLTQKRSRHDGDRRLVVAELGHG